MNGEVVLNSILRESEISGNQWRNDWSSDDWPASTHDDPDRWTDTGKSWDDWQDSHRK